MPNSTDIKLLADQIRVEGRRQVIVEALDLCVDSTDRRSEHTTLDRRALVHDSQDQLTINYDFDYPGGVKINGLKTVNAMGKMLTKPGTVHLTILGNTKVSGHLQVEGWVDGDLKAAGKILFHGKPYPGAVAVHPPGQPPPPPAPPLDLAEVVFELQQEVAALKKKVGI
jgi:hypothetical protein